MKSAAINLLILDDHTLLVGPLSKYLINRFGSRVNISTFFDADKCVRKIDGQSHVMILDYISTSKGLDENMNAAKSTFLLKGYYNKKEKREAKRKKDIETQKAKDINGNK